MHECMYVYVCLRFANQQVILEIARAHGKTAAQVALQWNLQRGGVSAVIPKSSQLQHTIENSAIGSFLLTEEEVSTL